MRCVLSSCDGQDTQWIFDDHTEEILQISEDEKYELKIYDAEDSHEYYLQIGDDILPNHFYWRKDVLCVEAGSYFESAAGNTTLFIKEKVENIPSSDDLVVLSSSWYVLPSKLGEQNYKKMVSDLHNFCRALINDTIGKSKHSREWQYFKNRSLRTHEEEFLFAAETWHKLSPILDIILSSPCSIIQQRQKIQKPIQARSRWHQRELMKRGIDPRESNPSRKCYFNALYESYNTPSHRLLKSFLLLLFQRVQSCSSAINNNIKKLQEERSYNNENYCAENNSKITALQKLQFKAHCLLNSIQEKRNLDFWLNITDEKPSLPTSEYCSSNIYYIHVANIILDYLRSSYLWTPVTGNGTTTKKSSRLYEQWNLLQIISGFRKIGLPLQGLENIVSQFLNLYYNCDIPENASVQCNLTERYSIVIRYEPNIKYKYIAEQNETLCHYRQDMDDWWKPDITIELQDITTTPATTLYVIVLDCKYSQYLHEQQIHNTEKYKQIRATTHHHPISKQLWIIYLGNNSTEKNRIYIHDTGMRFSEKHGPYITDGKEEHEIDVQESFDGTMIVKPIAENDIYTTFAQGTVYLFNKIIKMRHNT